MSTASAIAARRGSMAVRLECVRKHFGDVAALDGVTADIEIGSVVAVLGPNGAGKTTLMEMLEGFTAPTSGLVRVLGEDPRRASLSWRARVGMVAQTTALDPQLTVREVLTAFASAFPNPLATDEALDLVGLTAQAHTRIQALSGGQQRRTDLAAAVIGRPALLFLDEPTTGLDPVARRQTWSMVEQLAEHGTTVLLTTHYLDEANQLADRVLVLAHGRLIADATPEAVRARAGGLRVRFRLPPGCDAAGIPSQMRRYLDPDQTQVAATGDAAAPLLAAIIDWARTCDVDLSTLEAGPPTLEDAYLALTNATSQPRPEDCHA